LIDVKDAAGAAPIVPEKPSRSLPVRHFRKLIYLLADGAHARFVQRSPATGAFVTVRSMLGERELRQVRDEQRDEPAGRSFESASAARHGVGREDVYRRAKEAFARKAAGALDEVLAEHPAEGVVLVAPRRLLGALRMGVPPGTRIAAEIGKDLTKARDHDLAAWLAPHARL
jgi:protein required for attachment to host cells